MKRNKKHILFVIIVLFTGCSSFSEMDIHMNPDSSPGQVKTIIIGRFERRNLSYDPYIKKNFKDLLKYKFSKLGYKAEVLPVNHNSNQTVQTRESKEQTITALDNKYKSYIIVQGMISENNYGDAVETEVSVSIILTIFDKNGKEIGQAISITSKSLSDNENLIKIADALSKKIHSELIGNGE